MAEFSGENSYEKLLTTIYGARMGNISNSYKEYIALVRIDEIAKAIPVSFIRSGYYGSSSGYVGDKGDSGFYLNDTIYTETSIRALVMDNNRLYKWSPGLKNDGFSVRCVAKSFYKTTSASFL